MNYKNTHIDNERVVLAIRSRIRYTDRVGSDEEISPADKTAALLGLFGMEKISNSQGIPVSPDYSNEFLFDSASRRFEEAMEKLDSNR